MPKYKLIQADCLEAMKEIAPGSVDLTVTSPPYDNLRTYSGSLDDWNPAKWRSVAEGLFEVTKEGGVVVWVVADATIGGSETGTSFRQALDFLALGFNLHDTMIYEKAQAFGGSKYAYLSSFEYMFVFSKGRPRVFNPICDRENVRGGSSESTARSGVNSDKKHPGRKERFTPVLGKRKNICRYGVGGGSTGHPAVFPEKLAQDHILSWSNFADVVFDPFLGSGTTGGAAMKTGRNFIGIEREPQYFEIAKKRIEDAAREAEEWESVL
jgi:site-specific DNA-methyltransferase (adenine-specific)